MNNILLRALTGGIFVIIVIGCLYYSVYSTIICLGLFALFGLIEFYSLFKNSTVVSVSSILGTSLGMILFLLVALYNTYWISAKYLFLVVPIFFLSMLLELWRQKLNPLLNLGIQFYGIIYVAIPFVIMTLIPHSLLIFMFVLIWCNDTFAYLSGRMMGRTKLFERISPNKTWEGTIGGILMTIVASLLIVKFTEFGSYGYFFWILAALMISSTAILGDLLESLFKRSLKIKDSGKIMPGHGGILDRFDAALFAAPFFFCWWSIYNYF